MPSRKGRRMRAVMPRAPRAAVDRERVHAHEMGGKVLVRFGGGGMIKPQHKMKTTRQRWRGRSYDFYLIG